MIVCATPAQPKAVRPTGVYTLIEESDLLEEQAEAAQGGLKLALPELNIGTVHGRMKPPKKQAVMQAL